MFFGIAQAVQSYCSKNFTLERWHDFVIVDFAWFGPTFVACLATWLMVRRSLKSIIVLVQLLALILK